jgi:hypothetical protein
VSDLVPAPERHFMVQFVYGVAHPFLFGSLELLDLATSSCTRHRLTLLLSSWAMMFVGVGDCLPPIFRKYERRRKSRPPCGMHFRRAGNPDFYQERGCVAAKEDATHALCAVGRICDAQMVFGVFHDNQASWVVQQQLGVKVQPMRLCLREWNRHLVRGHDVAHGHVHGCYL